MNEGATLSDPIMIAPMLAMLLGTVALVRRLDAGSAARLWAWSFVALYVSAALIVIGAPRHAPLEGVAMLGDTAFIALCLAGALAFAHRPIPRWLSAAALALAVIRVALHWLDLREWAFGVAVPISIGSFAVAGVVVWRNAVEIRAPSAERALGPAILVLGAAETFDLVHRMLGGSFDSIVVPFAAAGILVGFLETRAIADRARVREQARRLSSENERRALRAVLETAPLGIFLFDNEGQLSVFNRAGAHMLGAEDENQLALQAAQEIAFASAERVVQSNTIEALRSRVADEPDSVIADVDATFEDRQMQIFSGPVSGARGERIGRVWIARDVTTERELQTQLQRAQKMETLGTLASGVAHDFNNQLTTILGNARIALEESDPDNSLVRESLTDLERAADHCARLTSGLLSFARRSPVSRDAVHVGPLIRELEGLLTTIVPPRSTCVSRSNPIFRRCRPTPGSYSRCC